MEELVPCLSLVFAPGQRPAAGVIADHLCLPDAALPAATVSHAPADGHWIELLSSGLTFDCAGLAPGPAAALPPAGAAIGMSGNPGGEAITLAPGPHLSGGAGLLPVLRIMAGLGARLAGLPGLLAVIWSPAGTWVEPATFVRAITAWLGGGAFPALALTGLERESNGAMVTRGLGLLCGQELRIEPDRRLEPAAIARIAVRLIHDLITVGPIERELDLAGPAGEALLAVPVRGGNEVRILIRSVAG